MNFVESKFIQFVPRKTDTTSFRVARFNYDGMMSSNDELLKPRTCLDGVAMESYGFNVHWMTMCFVDEAVSGMWRASWGWLLGILFVSNGGLVEVHFSGKEYCSDYDRGRYLWR